MNKLDFLFRMIFRVPKDSVEDEYIHRKTQVENYPAMVQEMDTIDSKSSALLTHVSIMLAVVAVLVESVEVWIWQVVLVIELLVYSVFGLILLRCVDITGPPRQHISKDQLEAKKFFVKEELHLATIPLVGKFANNSFFNH